VGSIFEVAFWVFDQQSPARNATVSRTVAIVEPCDPGLTYCAVDQGCGLAACSIRESIRSSVRVDLTPPTLNLSTHHLTLDYLAASPVSLSACASGACASDSHPATP